MDEEERLAKLRARRELEFQEQIKNHGGTGFPPGIDPIEACKRGVCLKCGGQWDALHTHVWKHYAGLSMAEGIAAYRQEFEIPPDVKLDSDRHCERLRQAKLKHMAGPNGERTKHAISESLSRPRPDLYGKTGPKSGSRSPIMPTWEIVKRLTSGVGQVEVAKELNAADHATIGKRARSVGLAFGAPFLSDFGQPFSNGSLFDLRRASGFEAQEFERITGLSEGRANGARAGESIANPDDARLAIEWRDGVVRDLLRVANSGERALRLGKKVYRQDEVFRTLLPRSPELNQALVLTIREIRQAAREHPEWSADQLCESVCRSAAIEQSTDFEDTRWRTAMQFLWQADRWISANLDRLRGTEDDDGPLVREMIGSRYGASQWTVQNALRDRTEIIDSHVMNLLIRKFAPSFAKQKPSQGGAPTGLRNLTRERIRRMAALETATNPRWTKEQMAPFVFWNTPESCEQNIRPFGSRYRREIDAQKKTLSDKEIGAIIQEAKHFLQQRRS